MINFCFFLNQQNKVELFPSLTNATSVVSESVEQTGGLKGKRQLSVIRREEGHIKHCFVVFNYVYGSTNNSCGICLVIRDKYPTDIKYLFACFSTQIKDIIEEGKVLYIDKQGEIRATEMTSEKIPSALNRHLDNMSSRLHIDNLQLATLSSIPNNYYKISKYQTAIYELADESWNLTEALNYNNIVIVTEEIEDENIHNFKNVVRKQNEEIMRLKENLNSQKATNLQLKAQKNKYGYVIMLLLLLSISIGVAFALKDKLNDSREQHEITKNALEDSLAKNENIIKELQKAYRNEQDSLNDLQGRFAHIEHQLREMTTKKDLLENNIRLTNDNIGQRQPFVITSMSYDKSSGMLSVSYYGATACTYEVRVKALYIKSHYKNETKRSYDYGCYDLNIEEGLHTCNIHIGKHYSKNYVLIQGDRVVGGDVN